MPDGPMFGTDVTLTLAATVTHPEGADLPPPYAPGTADVDEAEHAAGGEG